MFLNRFPQTYMPLLWPLGRSPPLSFYNAVVWVLYASQISLYLATLAFAAGAVYGAAGNVAIHLHLMVSGLYLFYFSVMYIQLPGFINAAPSRPLSALLLAALVLGLVLLPIAKWSLLPFALMYALLHLRALRGAPNYYPNWIQVSGLAATAAAGSPLELAAAFPLASVLMLSYRIDSSRARLKFTAPRTAAVAASYLTAFAMVKMGLLWGVALPLAVVSLAAPPRVHDLYGVGAAAWRLLMAGSALHHHLLYMGFAVVMSTLCVPFFLPAVLYRRAPMFGPAPFLFASAATALRLLGLLTPAALAVMGLLLYIAAAALAHEKVPLLPPEDKH
jgi:hypothetical protein